MNNTIKHVVHYMIYALVITHNIKAENAITKVDVLDNTYSTQIMFDFNADFYCPQNIQATHNSLQITLPGIKKEAVTAVLGNKLDLLVAKNIISSSNIAQGGQQMPVTTITLTFNQQTAHNKNNRFLIKWSWLDRPNRLIIDIFEQQKLETIVQKNALFLYAHNNTIQSYDISPQHAVGKKKNIRIVLDPGHGGSDTGAVGPTGLQEKTVALDITKRTYAALKKRGYSVVVTRKQDIDVPLVERSAIAHTLRGDVFVSIHANAKGNPASDPSGIETFFVEGSSLLPGSERTGIHFVNSDQQPHLVSRLNNLLKNTIDQSKALAGSIQSSLITTLKNKKFLSNNRGVKTERFRLLLQNTMPSALVEVGFITNKQEERYLAQPTYRDLIAEGICDGIERYVKSH